MAESAGRHAPARQGPARGVAVALLATCVKGCRTRCISPVHGPKAVVHASGPAAAHALHKVNSQFRRISQRRSESEKQETAVNASATAHISLLSR